MTTDTMVAGGPAAGMPALRGPLMRQALPPLVALALMLALRDRLAALDAGAALRAAGGLAPGQWLAALAATALSFWAVGRYDALLHGLCGTGLSGRAVRRAGASAIALSQALGFGLVTGTLVRWRMLPGLGAGGAARLTALVALSFLAGWAVIAALALTLFPVALPWASPAALAVLGFAAAAALLSLCGARAVFAGRVVRAPSLMTLGRILGLTALDTLAAGLALFVLLPPEGAMPLTAFLPAFLLALGAGLVSGTPGGAGPFELTLLALAPAGQGGALLAAVFAWRAVYFLVPAALALAAWTGGAAGAPLRTPRLRRRAELNGAERGAVMAAPRAEAQLLFQGGKALIADAGAAPRWVAAETGQCLVALGDPLGGATAPALTALRAQAALRGRLPCLYKCSARTAATARRAGFGTLAIGREAWLDPGTFDLAAPGRAQLRRKLRKARRAGIRVERARQLPIAQMRRLHHAWLRRNGNERGFSMGRFCHHYLHRQIVYLAWQGERLAGFVSFHAGKGERTLDLMRSGPETPDGTMHALIAAAIEDAAGTCKRLSLAAVPCGGDGNGGGLHQRWLRESGASGLHQFKASFSPFWAPLYLAAPSRLALGLAAAEITREILRPAP